MTFPKLSYRLTHGLSHDGSCALASRFLNLQEKWSYFSREHDNGGARWRSQHLTCDRTGKWLQSPACGEWLSRRPGSQLGRPAVCTTAAQSGTTHKHTEYNLRAEEHQTGSGAKLLSLTFILEVLLAFISSKNCIFSTTRGSILGGNGRPVMTTARPKVSAKSRPSLAWQERTATQWQGLNCFSTVDNDIPSE